MALLKRVKSSTLMETLVATVLIVVVFMVASMVLNSVFVGNASRNDDEVRQELMKLQYLHDHDKLVVPYYDELGLWSLEVKKETGKSVDQMIFSAVHNETAKEISFTVLDE
ncbi:MULTISPECIES: hypothetical protein [Flavobacteriaceae]|uniref:hypothetical protein n=1 Tax=Flavobacteriaceae TaxID=49546 RepID=UPI00234BDFCD|nr:hypothetical protein [Muricauda sp. SP22]MDC6364013.1 hypothetical protein [Muricauda sp. SP22]